MSMKKQVTVTLTLNNASEKAVEEINKCADTMFEDLEYLSPSMDVEVRYKHENT